MDLLRRQLVGAAIAAPLAALTACSRQSTPGTGSESARTPGGAPDRVIRVGSRTIPASLKLTPQTIIVPDGARALAGVASDGKTLRIVGVDSIKPGSVVLLSDTGVFRATSVQRAGNELLVVPAACAINDLIADGAVRFENVRINPRAGHAMASTLSPGGLGPQKRVAASARGRFSSVLDALLSAAHADETNSTSGKLGDFDYQIQYTASDDAVNFDAGANGDFNGIDAKVSLTGNLAGFDLSGGAEVRGGDPENLALLVKGLVGEVNLDASAGRKDSGEHKGNQMLKIPKEFTWPLVIDGIPFLLKLGVAILFNEGLTNIDAQVGFAAKLTFKGSSGFDMKLPGEPKEAEPKINTDLDTNFSFTRAESVGLGPQALLVAMQCPRLAFGLGLDLPFIDIFAGPYIDVVTAASHTAAGAMALVPCQRNQLVVTGAIGCQGAFLHWEGDLRKEAYRKEIVRAVPDSKACRLEA